MPARFWVHQYVTQAPYEKIWEKIRGKKMLWVHKKTNKNNLLKITNPEP